MREQEQLTIPATEFVEALRRSRIADEEMLESALASFKAPPAQATIAEENDEATDADTDTEIETTELAKHLIRQKVLTRYQAKELLQGRFRRLRMDHFVIRDLLGVGGMGAVYRAYDEQRKEEVAFKLLAERFKHDAGMRARFRLEARAGMRLVHPGIVKTYELGVTDDVFGEVDYATMELFEGIALHELVGTMGPIPVNAACDMVCQAAEALEYIHSQGMVHRDIKPDNLLIDCDGNVKIIDFGLTLINEMANDEEFSLVMIFGHDCLGTPDYMPPEQAVDSQSADERSDIYSLGCSLFVALTATRPFSGKTGAELIKLHKTQPPPDPRSIVEKTPPEIARAVMRMLSKSPDDRFQTMAEVQEALQRFARQRQIEFSFSRLLRHRMALAIKLGRISRRRTSTVMHLTNAGRNSTSGRRFAGGAGSAAALQATDAPTDTSVTGRGKSSSDVGSSSGTRVDRTSKASAASGAESLLRDLGHSGTDAEATASGAMLKLPDGGLFRLAKSSIVIGRNRDEVDLWIDDRRLSGRHCRLTYDGSLWEVIDLESRNGTEVNGRRVNMAPVFGGDRLTLSGEVTMKMEWSRRRPGQSGGALIWWSIAAAMAALAGGAYWFLS